MAKKLNIWINIRPWLFGILLSALGMFLGYNLGSDTARLLGGEPGIWARLSKGLVWGGIISVLQWPIVRIMGVSPIRFIAAGALGYAIGYPLGQTFQGFMVYNWSLNLTGYWVAVFTFGLFLGVSQWWILHRHFKRAGLWILFSIMGWMLTGLVWLSGGEAGLEYGIITGLGYVWLVHSQPKMRGVSI